MKVTLLTREYPPEVYGGAGVHVEYLSRELSRLPGASVEVRCFGADRPSPPGLTVRAYQPWEGLRSNAPSSSVLQTMSTDLAMAAGMEGADVVHSHTWYANLAGHVASLLYGMPHVVTTHSLEPLRPWKAEQTGPGGYALSSFCEATAVRSASAVIAVSAAMREDVLRVYPSLDPARVTVIHNGIDVDEYRPDERTDALERHGVDPGRPMVLFVGRITRQKGIVHLLRAARDIDPAAQIVLAAAAPDTPEIAAQTHLLVSDVQSSRGSVVWIDSMLARPDLTQLFSHADVFVCPSIYEPLGIVNLEAMACRAPVVATAVGGIPEVVAGGVTGLLVPFEPSTGSQEPADPDGFARALAAAVNELLADPSRAAAMGAAGRARAVERFSWSAIAGRTFQLYQRLLTS
jgi:starch synthase